MQHNNRALMINQNLKDRDSERIISQFKPSTQYTINFIKHSSEEGVIRNGGRRGSAYAPEAILNVFKKLAAHKDCSFQELEVSCPKLEISDFDLAQNEEIQKIKLALKQEPNTFLFIGGGHDHIYTDLMAIQELHPQKKLVVVNIDPHLDMRLDELKNSGTPFRQFDKKCTQRHQLIQVGTHAFSNVKSSMAETDSIDQKIIYYKEVEAHTENFSHNIHFFRTFFPYQADVIFVLSLDVDAIAADAMEAVSAVNYQGLPMHFITQMFAYFKNELHCQYFGMYEYNPVYDNLSQKGARQLTNLINQLF